MTDSFACSRSALTDLMSAPAIVYVVTRTGSAERLRSVVTQLRAQGVPYLLVPVIDLTGEPGGGGAGQLGGLEGQCYLAHWSGSEVAEAFATVEIGAHDLVSVPSAPTAQPSVVYVDPEPDAQSTDHTWATLLPLARWLASAGVPAWVLIRTDPSVDASLAEALTDRQASVAAREHEVLLRDYGEQSLLLSDLRLEYDELLQRAIALEKERDAREQRPRGELRASLATRTIRSRTRLKQLYEATRSKLGRSS
jgi:hypothetical protein